ncbi:hypothetical protein E2C01_050544 [Portunus trituberculatus]|uniref:Uncharacterized protein n=1 Tax=Portunus trituberculatus TaxID=210409 RepID=A0A5B7G9A0_PORTR|nr:hypothetical protein [Portunus trituberculatus]
MVSEGGGNLKLVVNIEVAKDRDLCERMEEQNVFHFGKAAEIFIIRARASTNLAHGSCAVLNIVSC